MRIHLCKHQGKTLGWLPDDCVRWVASTSQDGQSSFWADRARVVHGSGTGRTPQIRAWLGPTHRDGEQNLMSANLEEDCGQKLLKEGLDQLRGTNIQVDSDTCAFLLRRCTSTKALWNGKRVHAHIIRAGHEGGIYLANLLIRMYGKCGCIEDARAVFDRIGQRNKISWNILIQAYAENGRLQDAIWVFDKMPGRDVVSWNVLVNMYRKCGSLDEARSVFDKIPQRNIVSWNVMITAYSQNGHSKEALKLFRQMKLEGMEPDKITFASILDACSNLEALEEGKENHASIIHCGFEADVVVGTALVSMYGKCGSLIDARDVFDKMPRRNVVSWNAMITAYSQNGRGKQALELFGQMQLNDVEPNEITFIGILDACAGLAAVADGKESHAMIIDRGLETDVVVGNALVNMYGKCASLDDAKSAFCKMPHHNTISWNTMITAYSQNGHGMKALKLFQQMQLKTVETNKITFICILDACAGLAALGMGKETHASIIERGLESDVIVGTALVNMYGKCESLVDARNVFDKMPQRDVVSWNAMVAAYSQNGHSKEALELFSQMELKGVEPNIFTFISLLDACAGLAALEKGKESHASIMDSGLESSVVLGTVLINMYGKCGSLGDARTVFNKMPHRDIFSWNAMIAAYSQNGHAKEALKLFQQMRITGMWPNEITFISILSGCSHAGLLDDGWCCFVSMNKEYAIIPTLEHFLCMVDLLGRAGQLDEAAALVNNMPCRPDAAAWMGLLGACRIHGDVERGVRAAEHVLEVYPKNAAPFVLLANIYAAAGKWDDASKVRKAMIDMGVRKEPGHSCIEGKNRAWESVVGDALHPQEEELYAELQG